MMRRSSPVALALLILAVCPSFGSLGQQEQDAKRTRDVGLTVQIILSNSSVTLPSPPDIAVPDAYCKPTSTEVKLTANATTPQNLSKMKFRWTVMAGRLKGQGRKVTWDLRGVHEGTYTVMVEVDDGHKNTASDSAKITVAVCTGLRYDPPPCPAVWVTCRGEVKPKESIVFEANVIGWIPENKPAYTWRITAGKIVGDKHASKITVDTSGLAGQLVTAKVSVSRRGLNPHCFGTEASCTTKVVEAH
ncbi:MAG TPA: hypothetical protein VGQ41_19395 [Pyrinomonadaceae bacterium]|jgi:hypothetical protein|nr:hypothetical protein [Pyrinomonadaceae bacterium]